MTLPDKATYRVAEVAQHFDVTERTVYLWIAHGQLEATKTPGGSVRVTGESLEMCKIKPIKADERVKNFEKPAQKRARSRKKV